MILHCLECSLLSNFTHYVFRHKSANHELYVEYHDEPFRLHDNVDFSIVPGSMFKCSGVYQANLSYEYRATFTEVGVYQARECMFRSEDPIDVKEEELYDLVLKLL